jgi:hypothetical protein
MATEFRNAPPNFVIGKAIHDFIQLSLETNEADRNRRFLKSDYEDRLKMYTAQNLTHDQAEHIYEKFAQIKSLMKTS